MELCEFIMCEDGYFLFICKIDESIINSGKTYTKFVWNVLTILEFSIFGDTKTVIIIALLKGFDREQTLHNRIVQLAAWNTDFVI